MSFNYKVDSEYSTSGDEFYDGLIFYINGEPIVLTPDDALNTFFNSGLEFLMLNNYLVEKS